MTTAKRNCSNCGHSDNGMCDTDKGIHRADCTNASKWTPDGGVLVDHFPGMVAAMEILCHKCGMVDSVPVLLGALDEMRVDLVSHSPR